MIITDGINVATLLTIYFNQHSFLKAKIPTEKVQDALNSANMQLQSKCKFTYKINLKKKTKKPTFWSSSNEENCITLNDASEEEICLHFSCLYKNYSINP